MDLHERTAGQWWQHEEKFVTVRLDSVKKVFCTAYERLGATPENAQFFMDMSLDKAIQGDHARGVIRILNFVRSVREGRMTLNPDIKILRETSNFALLDGGPKACGPIVSKFATELAIKKARGSGIAFTAARHQAQILTMFTRLAVDAGMVGIVMNQSFPTVAPFGGAGALFGNQPFAFGVPTARHDPVLYDASMTQSSASGMFLAAKQRQKVAPGLLLDEHGMPTTDATDFPSKSAYVDPDLGPDAGGTLTAIGDNHKGSGLVFILCLLSAVLSDTSPPWELYYRLKEKRGRYGSVFIVIDPEVVMPLDQFKEKVDAYIDTVKAHPRRAGVDEILYPGEKSQRLRREREAAGVIAIPESHYKGLCEVADEFGVPRPTLGA